MRIYLIDFENVHYEGLSGILDLDTEDQVHIFYSDNGKRLTFELHEQINNSPAKFFYNKAVVGGKNALDHQLSSYLGYLIGRDNAQEFYVVSKDQGYRHLVSFWKTIEPGIEISLIDSIRRISDHKAAAKAVKEEPEAEKKTPAAKKRSRKVTAKIESEEPAVDAAASLEEEHIAIVVEKPSLTRDIVKPVAEKAQSAAARVKTKAGPAARTVGEQVGQAAKKAVSLVKNPKVIEFILPQEVIDAQKKPRRAGQNNPSLRPVEMPAITEPAEKEDSVKKADVKSRSRKTNQQESAAAQPDKAEARAAEKAAPEKKKVSRRHSAKKGSEKSVDSAAEKTSAEKKGRAAVSEKDIVEIIPEAVGQEWLADIVEYVNNSSGKTETYNKIRRRLGQDHGRVIYNAIKKLI